MTELLKNKVPVGQVITTILFVISSTAGGLAYYYGLKDAQIKFEFKLLISQQENKFIHEKQDNENKFVNDKQNFKIEMLEKEIYDLKDKKDD